MAFADLRKAYDSVPRSKLCKAKQKLEIHKELIKATKELYREYEVFTKMGTRIIENTTTMGHLQGGSTSPSLFEIY